MPTASEPGHLLAHLLGFGRVLRQMGIMINSGQMIGLLQAIPHIDIGREEDFRNTCRTLLIQRREDWPLFEQAWSFWWATRRSGVVSDVRLPDSRAHVTRVPRRLQRQSRQPSSTTNPDEQD